MLARFPRGWGLSPLGLLAQQAFTTRATRFVRASIVDLYLFAAVAWIPRVSRKEVHLSILTQSVIELPLGYNLMDRI